MYSPALSLRNVLNGITLPGFVSVLPPPTKGVLLYIDWEVRQIKLVFQMLSVVRNEIFSMSMRYLNLVYYISEVIYYPEPQER